MAGVAEQPAELQTRQLARSRATKSAASGSLGIDAAAMESDVHLDEHVDLPSGALHRVGPAACDLLV